jgi:excisionase family DNA binding protein
MAALGDLLTTQEATKLTGYDVQHIRRLARSGKVKGRKWGKDWMIDRTSLLAYIESKGHGPQPKRKKTENMI